MSLELAYQMANKGQWTDALALAPANKSSHAWQTFKAVALARLQRWEEARAILEAQDELERSEAFLLDWLTVPHQRLIAESQVGTVLHPLYGTKRLGPILVKVVGPVCDQVLQTCTRFHRREFPHHELDFLRIQDNFPQESFEELRYSLEAEQEPSWLKTSRNEVYLVSAKSTERTAYSRGFGSKNVAVLQYLHDDPFQATTTSHELYHTLLDLNHSNGLEGPDDPGSVMGPWGLTAPLLNTYVGPFHRSCCSTTETVQSLVESEQWEEALRHDPNYLGLYQKVADRLLARGETTRALQQLQEWYKRDPGPEAGSAWLQLALELDETWPQELALCRGYGKAPNTHIYLAQACLKAYRFDLALDQLEEALLLDPGHLFARAMRGWSRHCSGLWEKADEDYLQVLSVVPDWEAVLQRRALLAAGVWQNGYQVQHDPVPGETWDEDSAWLAAWRAPPRRALELLEPFDTQPCLHLKGFLLHHMGDTDQALEKFQESLRQNLVSLYGRAGLAWSSYIKGEPQYRELARKVLEKWPLEPTCRWLLG